LRCEFSRGCRGRIGGHGFAAVIGNARQRTQRRIPDKSGIGDQGGAGEERLVDHHGKWKRIGGDNDSGDGLGRHQRRQIECHPGPAGTAQQGDHKGAGARKKAPEAGAFLHP